MSQCLSLLKEPLQGQNWSHLANNCMINWKNEHINKQVNVLQSRNGYIPITKYAPCQVMIIWHAWLPMSDQNVFIRKLLFVPDFILTGKCFEILTVWLLSMQASINILVSNYYRSSVACVQGIQCSLPRKDCSPE